MAEPRDAQLADQRPERFPVPFRHRGGQSLDQLLVSGDPLDDLRERQWFRQLALRGRASQLQAEQDTLLAAHPLAHELTALDDAAFAEQTLERVRVPGAERVEQGPEAVLVGGKCTD